MEAPGLSPDGAGNSTSFLLHYLDADTIAHILSFCAGADVVRFSAACGALREIAALPHVWRSALRTQFVHPLRNVALPSEAALARAASVGAASPVEVVQARFARIAASASAARPRWRKLRVELRPAPRQGCTGCAMGPYFVVYGGWTTGYVATPRLRAFALIPAGPGLTQHARATGYARSAMQCFCGILARIAPAVFAVRSACRTGHVTDPVFTLSRRATQSSRPRRPSLAPTAQVVAPGSSRCRRAGPLDRLTGTPWCAWRRSGSLRGSPAPKALPRLAQPRRLCCACGPSCTAGCCLAGTTAR